jgi:ribosome-binding factor A
MAREFSRTLRVADQIQRELAAMLLQEVGDPRLHRATISGVQVSSDLATAKIYVTPAEGTDAEELLSALQRASGFLRHGLAHRLRLRALPRLEFIYDSTLDRAQRLFALLDTAVPHKPPGCQQNGPEEGR